jgi:hypothetical protein
MPDWEKLNKELDQALSEMSDEDWKEWKLKRNEKRMKTAVEWLVEQLDCLNRERKENLIDAETFFKDKAALIQQAKGMENNLTEEYAKFCVARREAELSDVSFNQWMENNKITFKSK